MHARRPNCTAADSEAIGDEADGADADEDADDAGAEPPPLPVRAAVPVFLGPVGATVPGADTDTLTPALFVAKASAAEFVGASPIQWRSSAAQ